jgi:predicted Zn-dependent peptidase
VSTRLDLDAVRGFYRRWYEPSRAVLVICREDASFGITEQAGRALEMIRPGEDGEESPPLPVAPPAAGRA